jgi:large subunit ribosomal protein L25
MERIELKSSSREVVGKKVKLLRSEGIVPAVLFGANIPNQSIQMDERELNKVLQQAGSTTLINLFVDDEKKPHLVLAWEIQREVLTSRLQHVDFYQVQLDRKVKTSPSLEVVGESPLVEAGEAVLVQVLSTIEVECLPTDLIDSIQVDVSSLETLNDSITIDDLPVPSGITILADPDDVVVSVVPPRAALIMEEEEEEALEDLFMEGVELGEMEEGEMLEAEAGEEEEA